MRRLLYPDEAKLEFRRRFWRDPARKAHLLATLTPGASPS